MGYPRLPTNSTCTYVDISTHKKIYVKIACLACFFKFSRRLNEFCLNQLRRFMLIFDDNFLSRLFEVRIKWLGCATGECLGLGKNLIKGVRVSVFDQVL